MIHNKNMISQPRNPLLRHWSRFPNS